MGEVLGRGPDRIGERPCLWFHAVSVGEVLLLRPLVREMARRRPGWEVVISTTTHDRAGRGAADLSRSDHLLCPARL